MFLLVALIFVVVVVVLVAVALVLLVVVVLRGAIENNDDKECNVALSSSQLAASSEQFAISNQHSVRRVIHSTHFLTMPSLRSSLLSRYGLMFSSSLGSLAPPTRLTIGKCISFFSSVSYVGNR